MDALRFVIKTTNLLAFILLIVYALWSAILFDLGHHTVAIPIQNTAALLLPIGALIANPPISAVHSRSSLESARFSLLSRL